MTRSEQTWKSLRITWPREDVALLTLDMPGKSANIINDELQDDLEAALDYLCQLPIPPRGAIMISGKEKIFVAGADLNAIVRTLDWPAERIHQFCFRGQKLFQRLQELSFPTIAAIHGACVGGGLELAMGCSLLIATEDRRTILGLPETKLGLIPGWAGTVRLPRLLGLAAAIDLIANSELFSSQRALQLGIINQVVSAGGLVEAALAWFDRPDLAAIIQDRHDRQQRPCAVSLDERLELSERWARHTSSPGGVHPFAPKILAQHMIESSEFNFTEACASEARAMAQVYGCDSSRGLLNYFFLQEHNRKSPGVVSAAGTGAARREIRRVGIVGGGVMGKSIAQIAQDGGNEVVVWDVNPAAVTEWIQQAGLAKVSAAEEPAALSDVDLLLECVVEDPQVKNGVLKQFSKIVNETALVATNTSALNIQRMMEPVGDPSRCLGLHFCHPQLLQLVEVVRTPETAESTVWAGIEWVRRLRKTPLVVNDAPGFVVNRLLTALLDAAIGIFEAGVPYPKIDQALEEFGFIGGPFRMLDTIGIDTVVGAGRAMAAQGVKQVSGTPLLPMLVKKRRLGRKVGVGFYRYSGPAAVGEVDEQTWDLAAPYQTKQETFSPTEIRTRIFGSMLIAAAEIWERNVVAAIRDIDIAVIQGLSFPTHEGGLLFWADRQPRESWDEAFLWLVGRRTGLCLSNLLVDWQRDPERRFYLTGE